MSICFFDIDGTLANGLEVPLSAQEAIRELRNRGHLVFICTGRSLHYVRKHFSSYADGFICFNGRYAVIGEEVLYDCPLKQEEIRMITSVLDEKEAGYIFFNNVTDYMGGYLSDTYIPLNPKGAPIYNFNVFFHDTDHFHAIEDALRGLVIFNPHGDAPHADATILGSDKGDAIREVLKKLNIRKEDAYAFGDGSNDVCMMQAVAHGIAMGNGLDILKEAASYITDEIGHDGVRNALVHFGLIES